MLSEFKLPFTIPGTTIDSISTFSILLMIAFLTASYLAPRELKRRGLREEAADWSILLAVFGAIVGSKIGFVFEVWSRIWIVDESWSNTLYYILFFKNGMGEKYPGQAMGLWEALFSRGGLVFYGGLALTFLLIYIYLRRSFGKENVWRYGDALMPSLAIGYAIGRLGCMVSGDGCYGYGSSYDIPLLTMVYGPGAAMSSAGVRVWNTPVMEAFLSAGLFAFYMLWARYQPFRPGLQTAIFLCYNGVARFLVEFLRINNAVWAMLPPPVYEGKPLPHHNFISSNPPAYYFENWHWYGPTQAQFTALALVALGVAWIVVRKLYIKENVR